MENELFPFQQIGADFLASKKRALLGDEMGLGKTVQAIAAINKLKAKKVLIVCPAGLKLNWERECQKWLASKLQIQVVNGRKDNIRMYADVVIINYDILIHKAMFQQIIKRQFAVGIFDEAHYIKNRSSKRTKAVLYRGAIASRCVHKWFLTGTPILNRPVELYPILKACAPELIAPYNTFTSYARHFCNAYFDGFQFVTKGASNLEELNRRINSGFMLRRLKENVLKELPDKTYQLINIEPKNNSIKKKLQEEFDWSRKHAKYQDVGADAAEIAILRHELAREKVDFAISHIKDLLENVDKLVVFAYHKDVIQRLAGELVGYGVVCITGSTPSTLRQQYVDEFQNNKHIRLFIGQIQAAGTGLTLTASSNVVFVESSWVPGEINQAVDRCHRIGQKDCVNVQFLVMSESLEEHMLRTVIDKRKTIEEAIEDRSGISYLFT
jgi:SNF2 family DNA or RNA helicase